jgi:hypothetical protein
VNAIRAVSRQERGTSAASLDCFFDPFDLMMETLSNDLILLQSWSKDLFDIGQEVRAIHWTVQHKRGGDAIMAQP